MHQLPRGYVPPDCRAQLQGLLTMDVKYGGGCKMAERSTNEGSGERISFSSPSSMYLPFQLPDPSSWLSWKSMLHQQSRARLYLYGRTRCGEAVRHHHIALRRQFRTFFVRLWRDPRLAPQIPVYWGQTSRKWPYTRRTVNQTRDATGVRFVRPWAANCFLFAVDINHSTQTQNLHIQPIYISILRIRQPHCIPFPLI